jgi:pimeloyl-ACP methyl ester carboxylesterase
VLPSIRVPTLVLHRRGDRCLKVEEGRYLASRIPGATFVELSGEDHLPFLGDQDEMLVQIERFLAHAHARTGPERVLATVLTVASDAGPADAEHVRRVFAREVAWFRGRRLDTSAEPLVALFDGPGRAVQCGCSVAAVAQRSRITVRAGVHIGEVATSEPQGPIVEISRDIAAAAGPGEVIVSRMVVDLVPGSGLRFVDRGALRVRGLARDLPVLAASRG